MNFDILIRFGKYEFEIVEFMNKYRRFGIFVIVCAIRDSVVVLRFGDFQTTNNERHFTASNNRHLQAIVIRQVWSSEAWRGLVWTKYSKLKLFDGLKKTSSSRQGRSRLAWSKQARGSQARNSLEAHSKQTRPLNWSTKIEASNYDACKTEVIVNYAENTAVYFYHWDNLRISLIKPFHSSRI
jgi:hypothetical protein